MAILNGGTYNYNVRKFDTKTFLLKAAIAVEISVIVKSFGINKINSLDQWKIQSLSGFKICLVASFAAVSKTFKRKQSVI